MLVLSHREWAPSDTSVEGVWRRELQSQDGFYATAKSLRTKKRAQGSR